MERIQNSESERILFAAMKRHEGRESGFGNADGSDAT